MLQLISVIQGTVCPFINCKGINSTVNCLLAIHIFFKDSVFHLLRTPFLSLYLKVVLIVYGLMCFLEVGKG